MPPRKGRQAVSRRPKPTMDPNGLQDQAEHLSRFIKLVRSLPSPADTTEPPTKRVKTDHSAICIVRKHLVLPTCEAAVDPENVTITRSNVSSALALSIAETDPDGSGNSDWTLTIYSRTKKSTPFHISFTIPRDDLSPELVCALGIAGICPVNPGSGGSLWATTNVSIRQNGTSVDISLQIAVWWNESLSTWDISQTGTGATLRKSCIKTWYPKLEHGSTPLSWSPQDFYEAAYVSSKETSNLELHSMQVPGLEANLYPFQRRAVQWLLQREGAQWSPSFDGKSPGVHPYSPTESRLPVSFAKVKDADGKDFYLSSLFGVATRNISPFIAAENFRGGILAEEMGLGKTVEVISLILLHRRPEGPIMVSDPYLGRQLLATSATLIVTPSTLLDQWLSELEKHAPALKVLYYPGLKKAIETNDEGDLVQQMAQQDVVITTYEALRAEIWLASDEPDRVMRNPRQYERPKSPLVQLSWWRVCIDEAQMVENWTSNAAILAKLIPRVNAWGITGTPVKDNIQKDLRGLLTFLRFEPFASDSKIWKALTTFDKDSFKRLFNLISMRHTKSLVRNEIAIPPQRRYVITMPFSAVEEQHYQSLFQELAGTCGLDVQGNPLEPDWDPESPAVMAAMRMALDRLRQTALHPEVGNRNRRALGHKIGPMRTVAEVLDAMLEQSDSAMRTDQRNLLSMRLTRGQIMAAQKRVQNALSVWEEVREKSTKMVEEYRKELDFEIKEAEKSKSTANQPTNGEDESESDERDDGVSPRLGEARRRLRLALEIQHKAIFFCGNAYFSIKSDKDLTQPESEEFKTLEELEVDSYDRAKEIRKEILQESHGKAKKLMDRLMDKAKKQLFAVIPNSRVASPHGIESRRMIDALEEVCGALNEQADQLDDWREHAIQLLLKDLVDEDKGEVTGEEYEESTKLQDEILVFLQVLRAAVADRNAAISGQSNLLVEHESTQAVRMALGGEGPSPKLLIDVFQIRERLKPPFVEGAPLTSLKGIVSELRALSVKLRHDAAAGSSRAVAEQAVVSGLLKSTQAQYTEQLKAARTMEQEVERFTDTLNARLDFYRQLQAVSDTVAEFEGSTDDAALQLALKNEETLQTKVSTAESKHRYLLHLKDSESGAEEQRMCVICQSTFSVGVLTVCGHQFCKECITLWFRAHHNCPVCKRHLQHSNLHDITLKPQELKVHSEATSAGQHQSQTSPTSKKVSTIYTEFSPEKLAEIKNIDLNGPCFTTKVDTLVRHLLWLRESDPGAKSIVFSQYKEFLGVLALAFKRYGIGFASFDKKHGITRFRDDPGTEVFLLHARAHSSGLNLVNASHVFLCEPLVNTALELQAIARVDRIGQQHETTVWLYIVDGTVEESIYNLSVQRRLEHMGRQRELDLDPNGKGKSKESTPELLDASLDKANSMEMQQAQLSRLMGRDGVAGEAVDKRDLWTCLFGNMASRRRLAGGGVMSGGGGGERALVEDPVARGFLAGGAAEGRREG